MEAAAAMAAATQYPVSADDIDKVISCAKHHFKVAVTAEASGYGEKFRAKLCQRDENTRDSLKRVAEDLEMDPGHLMITCQAISDVLKKKSAEEVLEIFDVSKDFSPAEQEELRILLKHTLDE